MPVRVWREPLDIDKVMHPKAKVHIVENHCKGCGFCIQFCPRNVLEESEKINKRGVHPPKVVNETGCVLCCFCTSVCPDFAVYAVKKECGEEC